MAKNKEHPHKKTYLHIQTKPQNKSRQSHHILSHDESLALPRRRLRQRVCRKSDAQGGTSPHAERGIHGTPNSHNRQLVPLAQGGPAEGKEEHREVGEIQRYPDNVSLLKLFGKESATSEGHQEQGVGSDPYLPGAAGRYLDLELGSTILLTGAHEPKRAIPHNSSAHQQQRTDRESRIRCIIPWRLSPERINKQRGRTRLHACTLGLCPYQALRQVQKQAPRKHKRQRQAVRRPPITSYYSSPSPRPPRPKCKSPKSSRRPPALFWLAAPRSRRPAGVF